MPTTTPMSRNERVYAKVQTASGAFEAVTGSNYMRHIKAALTPTVAMIKRRDKTGTRTQTAGIAGRKSGRWSLEQSLVANGTVATKPDHDPLFAAIMGQAAAVTTAGTVSIVSSTNATPSVVTATSHGLGSAGAIVCGTIASHATNTNLNGSWAVQIVDANSFTVLGSEANGAGSGGTFQKGSVKYALADTIPLLSIYAYKTDASTCSQRAGLDCVASEAAFNLGQDAAEWSCSGENKWVLESDLWSIADSTQKGGLASYPAEPVSPTSNGGLIPGFTGRAVLNGTTYAQIRSATISIRTGNALIRDRFGSYFSGDAIGEERQVMTSLSVYDDDSAAMTALRTLGQNKTGADCVYNVGTVAGSTFIFVVRGVQFATLESDDNAPRFSNTIGESIATGSSVTAKDELAIWVV
jgi:hypothetical protein